MTTPILSSEKGSSLAGEWVEIHLQIKDMEPILATFDQVGLDQWIGEWGSPPARLRSTHPRRPTDQPEN